MALFILVDNSKSRSRKVASLRCNLLYIFLVFWRLVCEYTCYEKPYKLKRSLCRIYNVDIEVLCIFVQFTVSKTSSSSSSRCVHKIAAENLDLKMKQSKQYILALWNRHLISKVLLTVWMNVKMASSSSTTACPYRSERFTLKSWSIDCINFIDKWFWNFWEIFHRPN